MLQGIGVTDPSYHHSFCTQQPSNYKNQAETSQMLETYTHKLYYSTESHHCCWWKVNPMAHITTPSLLGKRHTPLGSVLLFHDLSESLLSCVPIDFFHLRQSISGQIILEEIIRKCEWLHFQLLKWQPAHLLHQAVDILPFRIQSVCSNTRDILPLAQGGKKQDW